MSRFSTTPTIKFNRSKFPLNHVHKTTLNVGDLVPVYVNEVLPGDTFKLNASFVSRLTSSFVKVPLDNLYLDLNFFFVPNRLLWSKWVNLMGENTDGYWTNMSVPSMPKVRVTPSSTVSYVQTLADYLGYAIGHTGEDYTGSNILCSQLPFRAFAKIWNDWFRNENTQAPVIFDGGNLDTYVQSVTRASWAPNSIFGMPPKVSKFHDYFTSALPQPQKGSPVDLGISGLFPVSSSTQTHSINSGVGYDLHFVNSQTGGALDDSVNWLLGLSNSGARTSQTGSSMVDPVTVNNLWADLGSNPLTVNDIRYAFALQRILEADARYGTRYTEMIEGHFGVRNPDARLQRSEYLGGFRQPIQFQAVAQTSQGTEDSPQANLSAYSHSVGSGGFIKSFSEYGYVLGIACIRQKHTYSQGVNKRLRRFTRYDFYDPALAHIGEQPIYQSELFDIFDTSYDSIFGYQEAWAEYRYDPDRVSGYMRPNVDESLGIWNFADSYTNAPVLNQSFLNETSAFVDRTLSVPSSLTPNFLLDFSFNVSATRVMPLYSIPSLVDHVGNC